MDEIQPMPDDIIPTVPQMQAIRDEHGRFLPNAGVTYGRPITSDNARAMRQRRIEKRIAAAAQGVARAVATANNLDTVPGSAAAWGAMVEDMALAALADGAKLRDKVAAVDTIAKITDSLPRKDADNDGNNGSSTPTIIEQAVFLLGETAAELLKQR